jgi:hypothetical protein
MELILKNALVVAGVLVFFAVLRGAARRPPQRDPRTGELVLQCSPVLAWSMGAIAVGGPLSMAVLSFVIPFRNPREVWAPVGLGLFFLLLGGVMCLWAMRRRTRVGERGLTSEYVFARSRFLPWEEVERISFSSGQELWAHGRGQKAMLHVWFVGIREAVPLLEEHLPRAVRTKDAATLERFAATVGRPPRFEPEED